ncbi:Fanconi anemia group C protein [Bagarius yarrelli]|uniref:Fanconi anemia group C protein n=1 Tax=Bagarius yarrelli TaxID=175774 RepID=A0A556TXM6_BAGYA|nr:Fanconi anemia group C protein [Bagarius yarrelli]
MKNATSSGLSDGEGSSERRFFESQFYRFTIMAPLSELQMRFWMDKAVQWGQATSLSAQQDSSTTEAMKQFPFVGQFLGRLCWNPYVTADGKFMLLLPFGGVTPNWNGETGLTAITYLQSFSSEPCISCRKLLLQCLWLLYSAEPQNVVENRANAWIRNLLCHLSSEDEGSMAHALEKHSGFPPPQYYSGCLKKMVSLLSREVTDSRITSDATSESKKLVMEDVALMALWSLSLSSLEQAVLLLLERVLSDPEIMPNLETVVADSLLPKASALHCHIFLIVNDVFSGHRAVYELWFLLVQCGHWVDVAGKLLVSVESEHSKPLLFLLMFYHHPTNRGHQSTQHNMVAKQAWSDLRSLFLAHTLSPERLTAVNKMLCTRSANFVLSLLLNFAVFSQASTSRTADVLQQVLTDAGVRHRAMCLLCLMQQRLKGEGGAVDARFRMLKDRLHTS